MIFHHLILFSFIFGLNRCPISFASENDFFQLTSQPHFVDKTDFLAHLFEKIIILPRTYSRWNFTTSNYFFVTRPRGFGKTTNLKMIRSFAQFELNPDNTCKRWNETEAYKVFSKLKISQNEQIMRRNLAQYSVLYLDLTFDQDDLVDEAAAANALGRKMAHIVRPYEWCIKNDSLLSACDFLTNLLEGKVDPEEVHQAPFYVGKVLGRVGGKGSLLLIDNFDSAARMAVLKPGLKGIPFLYHIVHETIYEFTILVRSEGDELRRRSLSLMTGVSDMRFHDDEFKTSTIYRRSVFLENGTFSPYFGFMQQEVDSLMDKFNCSLAEKSDARDYYKGYQTDTGQVYLYNPISILEYIKSKQQFGVGKPQPYWARNESLKFVIEFAKARSFGEKLSDLIIKNEISEPSSILALDSTSLVPFFDDRAHDYANIDARESSVLIRYVYEHGFLRHKEGKPWKEFEFANKEVWNEISTRLRNHFMGSFGVR